MGKQWFPAAGVLLPAFLVALASALPLLFLVPDTSALQSDSKKVHLLVNPLLVAASAGASPLAEKAGWVPSRRAATLSPKAPGNRDLPLALALALKPHLNQHAPLATTGPAEEILVPGPPEIAATSPSPASPGPGHLTVGQTPNKSPGLSGSIRAPVSVTLRTSVTPRPDQRPAGGLLMGSGSSTDAVASRGGQGARGPLALSLPSRAPSSQSSSPSPPPSPVLLPSSSPPPAPAASARSSSPISVFSFPPAHPMPSLMVTKSATLPRTLQPGSMVPPCSDPMATLSFRCSASLSLAPSTSGSPSVPASPTAGGAGPTHPSQAVSLQDSASPSLGPSHVTHFVTFRITNEAFSVALRSPASVEYQLLSENIRQQLEPIYHAAFSNFKGLGVLVFRASAPCDVAKDVFLRLAQTGFLRAHTSCSPAGTSQTPIWPRKPSLPPPGPWQGPSSAHRPASVAVNASLVFGDRALGPSAHEVLWTLYCKVKAARHVLGSLALAEDSLTTDGSNLTDLALEIITICFTAMRPFLPQLLLPGSAPFVLLEEQILQQVTPLVSGFYKEHPQEGPLLLFSNVDQWVGVYIEYKFQNPLPTNLRGLANHLARNVMDPTLQKSSITANGEKAELVLYEMLLQILDKPFIKALKDKTSPEFQELQGQLIRGLTTILRPLQNFSQVVVKEFLMDPLTARVDTIFFKVAPAEALVQDFVHQGLHVLWEAEGLSVEMAIPDLGPPSSDASGQSDTSILRYAVGLIVLSLLLFTVSLVLVLKWKACCPGFNLGVLKPHPESSNAQ